MKLNFSALLGLILIFGAVLPSGTVFSMSGARRVAPQCSDAKKAELLAAATEDRQSVNLDCILTLDREDYKIRKRVVFSGAGASGATLDCNGSLIEPSFAGMTVAVHSTKNEDGTWSRPENVTIRNCRIKGNVKIWGVARNGEGEELTESSRNPGHTERTQDRAPRFVTLDRVVITAAEHIPLYLSPGVTFTTLVNSEINGWGVSVGIYMDAESGYNTIANSNIHMQTTQREQVAIDGSAHNTIIGNRFSGLNHGGIYLYRNCGEGGNIRHQTPSHNQIINNVFYYNYYTGENPAVWVASRNGNRRYCGLDDGYPYGSSASNLDHARYNVIAENQIYKRSVADMIRVNADPNYLYYNETVSESYPRRPGCFMDMGASKIYVRHGQVAGRRTSLTSGTRYRCSDHAWRSEYDVPVGLLPFECAVSGNNNGCARSVACPLGKVLVGVRAACNLETNSLSASSLDVTAWDYVRVARASDNVSDGSCRIQDTAIGSGARTLGHLLGARRGFVAQCDEHDANGGDCVIRGQALCL